jgi:hypothetical protein
MIGSHFNLQHFNDRVFMPYKSGLIQAAVGGVCTMAFVVSQLFSGGAESKQKRITGKLDRVEARTFSLTDANAKQFEFELSPDATVYLNEKKIELREVSSGRNVDVRYEKQKGRLVARVVDVFPTHEDVA